MLLIRHAEADHGGRLVGRTDVPAILPDETELTRLRGGLTSATRIVVSPALRCQMTAKALFPESPFTTDSRLWEQNFGQDEGRAFADLADLGPLSLGELAAHKAPDGESFLDMCARVTPALREIAETTKSGCVAVVAHAGTVRAALGSALGDPSRGLAFEVAPLSGTLLRAFGDQIAIVRTNASLAP